MTLTYRLCIYGQMNLSSYLNYARCNVKPDGVTGHCEDIQTSFTRDYMVKWEPWHAVREILQNFFDGIRCTFTPSAVPLNCIKCEEVLDFHSIDLPLHDEPKKMWCFSICLPGGVVQPAGYVMVTESELVVHQLYCNLTEEHALLRSTKNTGGMAGGFGEGFKVAAVVLLKQGLQLQYAMQHKTWDFEFKGPFGRLVIKQTDVDHTAEPHLTVLIRTTPLCALQQPMSTLFNPDVHYLHFNDDILAKLHSDVHTLHVCGTRDSKLVGNLYVHGILVSSDVPELKHLGLTANLCVNVTNRDRNLLANTRDNVLRAIEKTLQKGLRVNDYSLFEHLLKKYADKPEAGKVFSYIMSSAFLSYASIK